MADDSIPSIILTKKECPFCDKAYESFQKERIHVFQKHAKKIQLGAKNDRAAGTFPHTETNLKKFAYTRIIIPLGRPSCVKTFKEKSELAAHDNREHLLEPQDRQAAEVSIEDHIIISRTYVNESFSNFIKEVNERYNKNELKLAENLNDIMALASILLVKKNASNLPFLSNVIYNQLKGMLRPNRRGVFNMVQLMEVKDILQQHNNNLVDDDECIDGLRMLPVNLLYY